MARYQRKSIDTKVEEKEEMIKALEERLKKERAELDMLLQEQQNEKLRALNSMIINANLTLDEVQNILTNHTPISA